MRHDAASGEAAFLMFNEDGKLVWAVQYKDDDIVKALTEQEIADYFETARTATRIEKAIPGIKIH